ncbi:MAG TPA: hypothetical protein PKH07_09010, partial [bacterium]|nr:hypothetical protein [bacterium]
MNSTSTQSQIKAGSLANVSDKAMSLLGKSGTSGKYGESSGDAKRLAQNTVFYLGMGTCGLGAGAGKTLEVLKAELAARGATAHIVEVGCIGLCSAEPMMDVQLPGRTRVSFMQITAERVPSFLDAVLNGEMPSERVLGQHRCNQCTAWEGVPFIDEHPFFAPQTRWVLANCGIIDPNQIEQYGARGGYEALRKALQTMTPSEVCDEVERSGLRGRGGGGFPTGRKWKFALNAESPQKYLICNADEGDPGAFMDRAVIEGDPHRLVEGIAIAAYAIGASKAYIYIRAEYPLAIGRLKNALAQARECGLISSNILDTG